MMKLLKIIPIVSILALVIMGCSAGSNSVPATKSTVTNAETKSVANESSKSVDAALKTDAYDYYGIAREGDRDFSLTAKGKEPQVGVMTVKLVEATADKAVYMQTTSGALENMGEMKLEVDMGGVRVASATNVTPKPGTYDLPANLSVGKTWSADTEPSDGTKMEMKGTNKVVGFEKVVTKVGTYADALTVVSSGTAKQNGIEFKVTTKSWYVKGRGLVKAIVTQQSGDQVAEITLEENKPSK
jgi:hypothetical protein